MQIVCVGGSEAIKTISISGHGQLLLLSLKC